MGGGGGGGGVRGSGPPVSPSGSAHVYCFFYRRIQDIYTQLKKTKQAGQKKEKDRETPTSLAQGEDDNKVSNIF